MTYDAIIDQMTLEDKVALCSGGGFYRTRAFERYGIPAIAMADGPHGLRQQPAGADQLGITKSRPATCFPAASLTACSWDRALLRELGAAIGQEALAADVSIVLGPGANIKRNPLCGRNFEYFSEDPYLAGEMAAGWIDGVQGEGVGASLKHFAANNQESERMSSDSIVDERALREIYLPAFERAVRNARPATVMAAYNRLNGVYCSDHRALLRGILRDEWGFEGVVVSDWGAVNDRVQALEAGLDLEMPGSGGYFDETVIAAVRRGDLAEARLDESVDRLLGLIFAAAAHRKPACRTDAGSHHALAKQIAAQSAVLLKNEGTILPIARGTRVAVIGALAQELRYQGAGSSHINPTQVSSVLDGLDAVGLAYSYYEGYPLRGPGDGALLAAAVAGAQGCDLALVVAGLPPAYESEGFDRETMAMPASHNALIAHVAAANPKTVVVLVGGAPVEMPWLSAVAAVLNMGLAGQAGGLATAELLTGIVSPSGKLAESYPIRYADVPSAGFYETGGKQAQYREGIYVGYRYYDKAGKEVLFPFGHGLSYTTFGYSDLVLSPADLKEPYELDVSLTVENTGRVDGAEIVQLYVGAPGGPVFRPEKELKEFAKVPLRAGEAKRVNFKLDARAFALYDVAARDWAVPGGRYRILVGASSRDVRLQGEVHLRGPAAEPASGQISGWYANPAGRVTQADFESLLGRAIEPAEPPRKGGYTVACSFADMEASFVVRRIMRAIENTITKAFGGADEGDPTYKMVLYSARHTPLKVLSLLSPDRMPRHVAQGIVELANGRLLRAMRAFAGRPARRGRKKGAVRRRP